MDKQIANVVDFQSLESRVLMSAGDVDPYFGINGSAPVTTLAVGVTFRKVAVLGDGSILAAYATAQQVNLNPGGHVDQIFLRKFTAAGLPDSSFTGAGAKGQIKLPNTYIGRTLEFSALKDGSFYFLGGNVLYKFLSDGHRDTSFGTNGAVAMGYEADALGQQPDGSVLVTGYSGQAYLLGNLVVSRLDAHGHFDSSFGDAGTLTVPRPDVLVNGTTPDDSSSHGVKIVIASDGGAFIIGDYHAESVVGEGDNGVIEVTYGSQIVRLRADGSLDSSFDGDGVDNLGPDGREQTNAPPNDESQFGGVVIVQATTDGGIRGVSGGPKLLLFQLAADGSLVTTPSAITMLPGYTPSYLPQFDGKVLVWDDKTRQLYRLNADLSTDSTFPAKDEVGFLTSMAFANDGSILSIDAKLTGTDQYSVAIQRLWRSAGPAAEFSGRRISTTSKIAQILDVTYRDDRALDTNSFSKGDLRITGPNGFAAYAKFERVLSANKTNGLVHVRYRLNAPGGSWDAADNGAYTVRLRGAEVLDDQHNAADARTLGTFTVNIAGASTQEYHGSALASLQPTATISWDDDLLGGVL